MGEEQRINPVSFDPPKMVKVTVGDKSFETFVTGHEIDQGALGQYKVRITLMAKNDKELLAMQEVLSSAIWPEPIGGD